MEENKLPLGEQGEEEEGEPDLITLTDEEGTEYTLEVIDAIDHKGVHYMAVVPIAEGDKEVDEGELELVFMKVGSDADGEFLDVVEDDAEYEEIAKIFEKRLRDEWEIKQ